MRNSFFEEQYVAALLAQRPADYQPDFEAASQAMVKTCASHLDIAYGAHERQTLDIFPAGRDEKTPLILFFHGGYWRRNSKNDRRFLARKWLDAGVSFALANYRIAPHGSLSDMCEDAIMAARFLSENAVRFAINDRKIILSGNSAGAHLAAIAAARANLSICGVCLLSGLFDVRPVVHTSVADSLKLTETEATAQSPIYDKPFTAPAAIFVGSDETEAFIQQSQMLHMQRCAWGLASSYALVKGQNHFSITGLLGDPTSQIGSAISDMIDAP
ncbi:MAG: alpha/beta hydrolase [Pseudomonadota bacterium]